MNYVIDIGNTKTKIAGINKQKVFNLKTIDTDLFMKNYRQNLDKLKFVDGCIISSVIPLNSSFVNLISKNHHYFQLTNNSKLPFNNFYKTKKTLGNDRMANIAGALEIFPGKNVLVIDAGTCITYDLITSDKNYLGGAISPGINMRFFGLNEFTSSLPLVKSRNKESHLIGNTTASSIQSGVINGILFEISGFIQEFKRLHSDLKVILCGGNSSFLADRVKKSIFVSPNLTLIGLNSILEFQRK